MRIAAAYIPHYFLTAELRRQQAVRGQPAVIGDDEPPRRVLDCSLEAETFGIASGMLMRQAFSRCPELRVVAPDFPYYGDLWQHTLDALELICPEVEDAAPGLAYLNITGLAAHFGGEDALAKHVGKRLSALVGKAVIGVADNKAVARAAAASNTMRVIRAGAEADFLEPLPPSALPLSSVVLDSLHLLGLERIGQVARLPRSALAEQFGKDGERVWDLANGVDDEPLRPRRPVVVLEESFGFDGAVAGVEVLVAASRQLVGRLVRRLEGRSARELVLTAELSQGRGWERRIPLREAVSEQERLLFIVKTALREHPPTAAITKLGLRLAGIAGQTGRQLSIGEKRWREALTESMKQLRTQTGHSNIYRCIEVEPWSWVPEDRYLLVEYDA